MEKSKGYMANIFKTVLFIFICLPNSSVSAEDDILDFLPAILANVEKRPPAPAEWRVANLVSCSVSFTSIWTVSDGESSRSSSVSSLVLINPNTSEIAEVEPGLRTFTWNLNTRSRLATCGIIFGQFTQILKSGYRYTFTLTVNSVGDLEVDTEEVRI